MYSKDALRFLVSFREPRPYGETVTSGATMLLMLAMLGGRMIPGTTDVLRLLRETQTQLRPSPYLKEVRQRNQ